MQQLCSQGVYSMYSQSQNLIGASLSEPHIDESNVHDVHILCLCDTRRLSLVRAAYVMHT
jgi:hypothetical protein